MTSPDTPVTRQQNDTRLENIFPLIKSQLVIRGHTVCMRLLQAHTHLQSSNFLCFLKIRLIPKI
jgi:hypothetical protein